MNKKLIASRLVKLAKMIMADESRKAATEKEIMEDLKAVVNKAAETFTPEQMEKMQKDFAAFVKEVETAGE